MGIFDAAANELVLEASPVVAPLHELLKFHPWEGTATELLGELASRVEDRTQELTAWPKGGRSLSNALRRLAPNLRAAGIEVDFGQTPGSKSKRFVKISKGPEFSDANVANDISDMEAAGLSSQVTAVATPLASPPILAQQPPSFF